MTELVVWYVAVQCVAALGFAFASRLCPGLPDRGYCASKTLGIVFLGVTLWLGTAAGILRNGPGGALLAAFALIALAASWQVRERSPAGGVAWLRANRSLVLGVEILFLAAFAGWCLVRAHDPATDHTEEPMDLMLLAAVSSGESFPPRDPWLAGYPISYYYLGYWLLGTLGRLTGTLPELTYNLGQATWFGLLVLGSFGLGFNLAVLSGDRSEEGAALSPARLRHGFATGLLAATLVALTANVALPLEWLARWRQGTASSLWGENWWWWRSSRVVQDVGLDGRRIEAITEFPFFSYLLGDNHPHVLAMPVVVATLTLALGLVAAGAQRTGSRRIGLVDGAGGLPRLIALFAVAGSIAAINTWDVPAVWSIVVLATASSFATAARGPTPPILGTPLGGAGLTPRFLGAGVVVAAGIVVTTLLLYLPYHLTASSQVRGVVPNLLHPTGAGQVLVMFATLLPAIVLLVAGGWETGRSRPRRALLLWLALLGASAAWLIAACWIATWGGGWDEWLTEVTQATPRTDLPRIALERWMAGWPTLVAVAGGLAFTLETLRARRAVGDPARGEGVDFALLLAAGGLGLVLLPEVLYLHDSFGTRMNTVFKFWYQAWLLLACAGAVGITLAWRQGRRARAAAVLALLAVLPGFIYPVRALWTKTAGFSSEPTLDALAWLDRFRPHEREAIEWIRSSTPLDAVVVQRSGDSYRGEHNLVSIVTSRATLLGWGGHEYQWRGASFASFAAGREEALARIYGPSSGEELRATLEAWAIDYVYLGPEERSRYRVTAEHEALLVSSMDLVFENPGVRIFRRRA